jgi:hypothetical protein
LANQNPLSALSLRAGSIGSFQKLFLAEVPR